MLFEDLKTLVAVMETNSLTGAAGALSLTQSAISRRIQSLESTLGAQLLDRASKPPRPTALAHRIYRHALPLLRDVRYLLDIPRGEATPSGTLRLGLTQLVADVALAAIVAPMRAAFPALELKIGTAWRDELLAQLQAGQTDIATLMMPSPSVLPDGLQGTKVGSMPMLVVQSRRQRLVASKTTLAALAEQEWVLNPNGCATRAALEGILAGHGKPLRLVADTLGSDMQLALVAEGLGLGLVSAAALRHSRHAAQLSAVRVADFALTLDIWMIHPGQLGNLRKAAELLETALRQALSGHADKKPRG